MNGDAAVPVARMIHENAIFFRRLLTRAQAREISYIIPCGKIISIRAAPVFLLYENILAPRAFYFKSRCRGMRGGFSGLMGV